MSTLSQGDDQIVRPIAQDAVVRQDMGKTNPIADARFRLLIEQLPVIAYTEAVGDTDTYTYISPQIEDVLGYTPDEVIRHPGLIESRIHPDDVAQVQVEGKRTTETGEPFRMGFRLRTRDGRVLHVRDEAALVRDAAGQPLYWQGVIIDMTQQRQAETALSLVERRYRELFDDAPVMYVTTRNESGIPIIDDCNVLFLTTLDYPRDAVIGRSIAEFFTEESREALLGGGYAAALAGTLPPSERQLRARDGRIVDALVLTRPIAGEDGIPFGTRATFIDITERKKIEAALSESVHRGQALMMSALDAVVAMSRDGQIIEFNPAAERTFGYRREQAVGQLLAELIVPPPFRQAHQEGLERYLKTGDGPVLGKRLEMTAQRSDGSIFPVELTITPLGDDEDPKFFGFMRDISNRVAVETALRASEERFRSLVQGSYDVITVVDRKGSRTYASPSIEHLLGYPPTELIGKGVSDLVHPDDQLALSQAMAMCLEGAAQTPALELRFRHRNGAWRDFETVGTNLLDEPGVNGIVFNSRDITARKATEAALRESEELFRTAFDHAPIGLSLVSSAGQFLQVNKSLCELVGYTESELLHMTFQDITHPDDLEDDLELARRLFAGEIETFQIEKRYLRKDGHPIWIELTASAVQTGDGRRLALSQIQDVTGRRHLDLERATMLASERAYIQQLRDLATMREDLSKVVAHELRSPVAALRMMATALATGDLAPDDASSMVEAFHGQIDQLDRLITDVTAAAAAERENFSVQLHAVPVAVLLSGAAAIARSTLGDRPFSVRPVDDIQVWCDPERISQVLRNLLDNIAKHTLPGTPVEVRAFTRGDWVRIEVADRGPGIPAEDLLLIFEKFGRGREAAGRQVDGLGLGLYVSHQIVEAHGTELTVESSPNTGTVFGFDLRVAR